MTKGEGSVIVAIISRSFYETLTSLPVVLGITTQKDCLCQVKGDIIYISLLF